MGNFILGLVFALFLFIGCAKTELPTTPSTGGGGSGEVGVVDNDAGFYVHNSAPDESVTYEMHKSSGFSTDCKAASGEDITCILDGEEMDFFRWGVKLQVNVPTNLCEHFIEEDYMFYSYPVGDGPRVVRVDTDMNGVQGIDCDNDGLVTDTATTTNITLPGGSTLAAPFCDLDNDTTYDSNEPIYITRCPYDYSAFNGRPNCCGGTYSMTTRTTWDAGTSSYTNVSATNNVPWGGRPINCIAGPGTYNAPLDNGFPTTYIESVASTGLNRLTTIKSPVDGDFEAFGNLYVANYYDTADHGNAKPKQLQDNYYSIDQTQPTYAFNCFNASAELNARISVYIREWNRKSDFEARVSVPTGHSAVGAEATFGGFINDYCDWKDIGTDDLVGGCPSDINVVKRQVAASLRRDLAEGPFGVLSDFYTKRLPSTKISLAFGRTL